MPTTHPTPAASGVDPGRTRPAVFHVGSVGSIFGGAIIAVGSVLPWVMTPAGSLSGTAGPGLWTLACGFLAIAGGFLPYRRVALGHAAVAGLGVLAIVVWQLVRLIELSATTASWGQLLPGIGMVMVTGGAVIVLGVAKRLWSIR